MIILGHIAGIPVEETLLSFVPVGAVGVGAAACAARARGKRLRRATARLSRRQGNAPSGRSSRTHAATRGR